MNILVTFDDPAHSVLSLHDDDFKDSNILDDAAGGDLMMLMNLSMLTVRCKIADERSIPMMLLNLYINDVMVRNSDHDAVLGDYLNLSYDGISCEDSAVVIRVMIGGQYDGLLGGKGGFGAMLRMQSKMKGKKTTTDFGACRDLSGRRLRHVNEEKIIEKWKEAKEDNVEFNVDQVTATGVDLWFLGAPAWAEKLKTNHRSRYLKPRRKTALCKEWEEKGECARGKKCNYAHGIKELRGKGLEEYEQNKNLKERELSQKKKDDYMGTLTQEDDDIADMVTQGLRAAKRARKAEIGENSREEIPASTIASSTSSTFLTFGDLEVFEGGEIEGKSDFGTAVVANCSLQTGTWFYEVELLTDGLIQIGWANNLFSINPEEGDGVGDDVNSWSYDGFRKKKWHIEEDDYGLGFADGRIDDTRDSWMSGDIIGSVLCLTENEDKAQKSMTISFTINGRDLGVAFHDNKVPLAAGFYPAISMEDKEAVIVNIGNVAFAYPPSSSYLAVTTSFKAATTTSPKQTTSVAVNLQDDTFDDLEKIKALGIDMLKNELNRRSLKAGGTIMELAERVSQTRKLTENEIPTYLKKKK